MGCQRLDQLLIYLAHHETYHKPTNQAPTLIFWSSLTLSLSLVCMCVCVCVCANHRKTLELSTWQMQECQHSNYKSKCSKMETWTQTLDQKRDGDDMDKCVGRQTCLMSKFENTIPNLTIANCCCVIDHCCFGGRGARIGFTWYWNVTYPYDSYVNVSKRPGQPKPKGGGRFGMGTKHFENGTQLNSLGKQQKFRQSIGIAKSILTEADDANFPGVDRNTNRHPIKCTQI